MYLKYSYTSHSSIRVVHVLSYELFMRVVSEKRKKKTIKLFRFYRVKSFNGVSYKK